MKKTIVLLLSLVLSVSLLGCGLFGTTVTTTATTTTPDETVYDVADAATLAAIDPAKNYRLVADIDLGGAEWTPIGTEATPYSGAFDGNGFTVSDFVITVPGDHFLGFFAAVSGTVSDLTLEDVTVDVTSNKRLYAGVLAGSVSGNLSGITVSNASVTVTNQGGSTYAGLLAGSVLSPGTDASSAVDPATFVETAVTGCRAEGTLTVASELFTYAGGLFGQIFNVTLTDCSAEADITASAETNRVYAGGLAGHNYGGFLYPYADQIERDPYLRILRCEAVVSLTVVANGTQASVGGFFGYDGGGVVEDGIALVLIHASGTLLYVGGFAGESWDEAVTDSVVRIAVDIPVTEGQTLHYGGITGFLKDETLLTRAFYHLDTPSSPMVEGGTGVVLADLQDSLWYQTTFGWTALRGDAAALLLGDLLFPGA